MENEIQERISTYVALLDTIKEHTGNNPEALGVLHEIMKDIRAEKYQKNKKSFNDNSPATDKQVGYLNTLGVEVSENLTKQKASELIEQAKQSKNNFKQGFKFKPLQISV